MRSGGKRLNEPSLFRPATDVTVASWLEERIEPGLTVTSVVPAGFEAYARLFHPAEDEDGNKITWKQIAVRFERVPHPRMQFHCLVSSATSSERDSWYR